MIILSLQTALTSIKEGTPNEAPQTYTVNGAEVGSFTIDGEFIIFNDPSNIFDRSLAANWTNEARAGYYDSGAPTKWHYTELTIDIVTAWLIADERVYFAPAETMQSANQINSITTFTTSRTGAAAEAEHDAINHELLTDSEGSTLFDSDNFPLWDS